MKNNLPKYWCVQSDGSIEFKKVISYLNNSPKSFKNNPQVLTLEQFIEMSKPIEEWTPKRGELVEVRDHGNYCWYKRIYITTIEGCEYPIVTVDHLHEERFNTNEKFYTTSWKEMRKITPTHKEVTLQEIADKFGISVDQLKIVK